METINKNVSLLFGYGHNCNSYLVSSSEDDYLMIDSGLGSFGSMWGYSKNNPLEELKSCLESFPIKQIVLTHGHLDHLGGVASLQSNELVDIKITCHQLEQPYIELPDTRYIDPFMQTPIQPVLINNPVSHDDSIELGKFTFKIIHTPGHTEGSMCLFEEDQKWLFSGDCVFPEGAFGRVDFPGSNAQKMLDSLELLDSLDIESLFAGHMSPILINASRSIHNSYVMAKSII